MKKVFLFLGCAALIVAGSMFLQSCEQSSIIDDACESYFELLLASRVFLVDNQFILDMSEKEARKKGIPRWLYQEAYSNLQGVNHEITSLLNNSEIEKVYFGVPYQLGHITTSPRLRSGVESSWYATTMDCLGRAILGVSIFGGGGEYVARKFTLRTAAGIAGRVISRSVGAVGAAIALLDFGDCMGWYKLW